MMIVEIDGKIINIGDYVCFKSDVEQSGKIVDIKSSYMGPSLTLENKNRFSGGYIGGDTITTQLACDCWI